MFSIAQNSKIVKLVRGMWLAMAAAAFAALLLLAMEPANLLNE
ncbi:MULTISPECIES: hypothetical protein [unclassified Bradyrhizobium]|nr:MULTISPECIES: hypothetical protein [unclassified Bradyrhizobium]